jgi:hypothetical protein
LSQKKIRQSQTAAGKKNAAPRRRISETFFTNLHPLFPIAQGQQPKSAKDRQRQRGWLWNISGNKYGINVHAGTLGIRPRAPPAKGKRIN